MNQYDEYILKPDTLLQGRYRIESVIGEGGFGITYAAVNEKIGMVVAIKELYCREYIRRDVTKSNEIQITYASQREVFEQAKKRFIQEARTLSGFANEKAIVKILDYFEENNTAYIVMNYLHGNTLEQELQKNGTMNWRDMLDKMKPIVETLERVHNRGIVHRDISAGNIMVLEDGSLALVDFGTVKDTLKRDGNATTTVFTKQGYTPVEQYAQKGNVGAWSDVYALSAVCYECLTGVRPPDSLQRSIFDEYKTVKEMGREIPEQLESVLQKGLAVKAEDRYHNMNEFLSAINEVLAEKQKKRGRKVLLAAILVCMLAAAGGACFCFLYREEIAFGFQDTETFLAVRDKDVSIDDFQKDFDRMEERIKILAGDEHYVWEERENSLRGVLPLACFGESNQREIIRDLVVRPGKWTINGVEIEENFVKKIEFSDKNKCNLVICLSENIPDDIRSNLKSLCEDGAVLSVDAGYSDHLSLNGRMDDSLTFSWDLKEQWPEKKMRELFLYNITNSGLEVGFSLYTQIQAEWETPDSAGEAGKYQCDIDRLDSNAVILEYGQDSTEGITEGTTTDFLISLKNKMDLLDMPYAIGRAKDDKQRIVLGVNQKDYNEDLFSLLLKDSMDIKIQDSWGSDVLSGYDVKSMEVTGKGDNTVLSVCVEEEKAKEAGEKIVQRKEKRGEEYYLTVNNIRLFKGDISLWRDDVIQFNEINMDDGEIGNHRGVVKLIQDVVMQKDLLCQYKLLAYQYSGKDDCVCTEPEESRQDMRFNTEKENALIEEVKNLSKDYRVTSSYDYEDGEEKLSILLPNSIYTESVSDTNVVINRIYDIMEECQTDKKVHWSRISIGIENAYDRDSFSCKFVFYPHYDEKDYERPYTISVLGYEKKETQWLKTVYEKMRKDERFSGYDMEFSDYSEWFIY